MIAKENVNSKIASEVVSHILQPTTPTFFMLVTPPCSKKANYFIERQFLIVTIVLPSPLLLLSLHLYRWLA